MWSNQENRVRKQVKNLCEAHKIKASQIPHKKNSTHLLTVLIIGVIVQLEQRKRDTKRGRKKEKPPVSGLSLSSKETGKQQRTRQQKTPDEDRKGAMTYVDA